MKKGTKIKEMSKNLKFNSKQAFIEYIQSGKDLYSPSLELYLFLYNEDGAICAYTVTEEKAKELKRIVHEVCSEISYLNHDDATEEFFFNAILNIYDDIALHHYNQKAEDFSNKYMDYIHNQISEIRYEF